MRTFNAKIDRPVWIAANCMLGWERNDILPDGIFDKQWKIMKFAGN